jgi:murein DD-endopeptidase MepM/ murein hydrolase activator NlpD
MHVRKRLSVAGYRLCIALIAFIACFAQMGQVTYANYVGGDEAQLRGMGIYFTGCPGEVGSGKIDPSGQQAACCDTSGSSASATDAPTSADMEKNGKTIFDFLIGKLTSPNKALIAAAVLGNFQDESGFDPRSYYPSTTTDNPDPSKAFGIAQWLGSRQTALRALSQQRGKPITDMGVQLDFLWGELSGSYKSSVLDPAGAAGNDLRAITVIWNNHFEINGVDPSPRVVNAQKWLTKFGSDVPSTSVSGSGDGSSSCGGGVAADCQKGTAGDYALPVDGKFYKENKMWFIKDHHDHVGADIPVPSGTPVFAMTGGKVTKAPNEGGYGKGVTIMGDDGVQYDYGHGSDGGSVPGAKQGDTVKTCQLIMHSDSTGESSGPHLHVSMYIGGVDHCAQPFFVGIAEGHVPDPKTLPTSGCVGGPNDIANGLHL